MRTHLHLMLFVLGLVAGLVLPGGVVQAQADNPEPPEQPVRLIFIHHSTGENWLKDDYGDLGRMLGENNYFVSDTNYGWGPDNIGDRTDIINWPEWFGPERSDRILNALYKEDGQNSSYTRTLSDPGGENEIILFKSCFPNSELGGNLNDPPTPGDYDYTVGSAKYIYNLLLEYFASRPDKMFVVITAPPVSNPENAANARAFNNWLVFDWLQGYPGTNVFVFDFYNVLTGSDNHHRFRDGQVEHVYTPGMNTTDYPSEDDHPSVEGSQKATDEFIPLLNVFYHRWKAAEPYQAPAGGAPPEEEVQPAEGQEQGEEIVQPAPAGLLEDFEGDLGSWSNYDDGLGSGISCNTDQNTANQGNGSLRIEYSLVASGYAGCERYYDGVEDWSDSEGISLDLHSQVPGQWGTLIVVIGSDELNAPFEVNFEMGEESVSGWQQFYFAWEDFVRSSWAEENGPQQFDPAQVLRFDFSFGAGEEGLENVVWVDQIQLGRSQVQPAAEEQPEEEAAAEEPSEEESPRLGDLIQRLCPFSSLALPLVVGVFILRRKVHYKSV